MRGASAGSFRGAHEEMAAAHRWIDQVQPQHGKSEGIIALFLIRLGCERISDGFAAFDFSEQWFNGFAQQVSLGDDSHHFGSAVPTVH